MSTVHRKAFSDRIDRSWSNFTHDGFNRDDARKHMELLREWAEGLQAQDMDHEKRGALTASFSGTYLGSVNKALVEAMTTTGTDETCIGILGVSMLGDCNDI